MSASVLQLTPLDELERERSLGAFIEICKKSELFDARNQFDRNAWRDNDRKGHSTINRLIFSTLGAARANLSEPCMAQPFIDFAKAIVVHFQETRPITSSSDRLIALRCLEAALVAWNKGARPTAINVEILDAAVEIARKNYTPGRAYRLACQIKMISELLRTRGWISLRSPWEHGLRKPTEAGSRISKEALAARQSKLPSSAVLRALVAIFRSAVEPGDVVVSSYCALMLCAPERVNELLRLRRDCLEEGEGEFRGKFGLRWPGSKGFENTIKWLPTEMVPVAREAINQLLKMSVSAQEIAAWYTANPGKLFLHDGAKHLEGKELLSPSEIALLLWGDGTMLENAANWARTTKKLTSVRLDSRRIAYHFSDVEKAILDMLPRTFPNVPGDSTLLCEDIIALTRISEMALGHRPYLCMFKCISYGVLNSRFATSKKTPSIFERFGHTEEDGSSIKFKTHSPRHYLNTLAQIGGLSSAEIAIFSGRKDVRQNRDYDHMTSEEVQAPISKALKAGFTSNLESMLIHRRSLVSRAEFKGLGLTAAHTTEYGWCAHDFASEPCQMYRDCINCEEQECIKGEAHKELNLRQLKDETTYLLAQAREALNDEEYGADAWVAHQSRTLERINALLRILEDPAVPVGSRIRLDKANMHSITENYVHPVKGGQRKVLK